MLKKGERVWIKATKYKERGGEIVDIFDDGNLKAYQIKIDATDVVLPFYPEDIRSIGTASVITIDKSGGTKHDTGKNRLELIPVSAIEGIGRAMTFGAKKYADHNWAKGFDWSRLTGAALRHLLAWQAGEDKDPESGLSHLDHLGACVAMLIAHENEKLGNDDRRKAK